MLREWNIVEPARAGSTMMDRSQLWDSDEYVEKEKRLYVLRLHDMIKWTRNAECGQRYWRQWSRL
jgi:hypothetical protein